MLWLLPLLLLLPLEKLILDVVILCWCEARVAGGLAEGTLPTTHAPFPVPCDAGSGALVLGATVVCRSALYAQVVKAPDSGSAGPQGDGPMAVWASAGDLFVDHGININAAASAHGAMSPCVDALAAEFEACVNVPPGVGTRCCSQSGLLH